MKRKAFIFAIIAAGIIAGCGNDNIRELDSNVREETSAETAVEETQGATVTEEATNETETVDVADETADETVPAEENEEMSNEAVPEENELAEEAGNNMKLPEEKVMDQFAAVIFSFVTGQMPIAECKAEALYYGETAYGTFEPGSFGLYDLDGDGNNELLLSYSDLRWDGSLGFCNVYKATSGEQAEFLFTMDGITGDGKIVRPATDSSIYIDFEIGHFENGVYVEEVAYSILDDGSEGCKTVNGQAETPIGQNEFNDAYSLYYNNLQPIYGMTLSLRNYEMTFNETLGEVAEVVVSTTDGGVNIRSGPGTEFEPLYEMVPDGTHFWVYAFLDSTTGKPWGKIRFGGQEGWISMTQVKMLD